MIVQLLRETIATQLSAVPAGALHGRGSRRRAGEQRVAHRLRLPQYPPLVAIACAKPPASHGASAVPLVSAFAVAVHFPAPPSADAWAVPDPLAVAVALARKSALASAVPDPLALAVALDFESALAFAVPASVAIAFDLPCVSEIASASPPVFAVAFDLPPVSALASQVLPSVPVCTTLWWPFALHTAPAVAWTLAATNTKNIAPVSNPIVVFSFTDSPPAELNYVNSRSSLSNITIWRHEVSDLYMTGLVVSSSS